MTDSSCQAMGCSVRMYVCSRMFAQTGLSAIYANADLLSATGIMDWVVYGGLRRSVLSRIGNRFNNRRIK